MLEECPELVESPGRLENQAVPHVGPRADSASLLEAGSFRGLAGPWISVRGPCHFPGEEAATDRRGQAQPKSPNKSQGGR